MKIIELKDLMPIGKFKGFTAESVMTHENLNYAHWFNENVKEYNLSKECMDLVSKSFSEHQDRLSENKPKKSYINWDEISNYPSSYQDIYG